MKYAGKPQKLNPNKPSNVGDWEIWEVIETTDETATLLQSQGWYISDTNNFSEWFNLKKICPASITPRQARQALILQGITELEILAAFNSLPSPTKELALTEWEYSLEIRRNRQLTNSVASMLGWTQFQLDQLFVFAGSL